MTTTLLNKQIVVLDLSWLQALPAGNETLPEAFVYVLSPRSIGEVVCREEQRRRLGDFQKLLRVIAANQDRIVVSQQINELMRHEIGGGCSVSAEDIVDWNLTEMLSLASSHTAEGQIVDLVNELSRDMEPGFATRRERFWLQLCLAHRQCAWTESVKPDDFENDTARIKAIVHSDRAEMFFAEFLALENQMDSGVGLLPAFGGMPTSCWERFACVLYFLRVKLVVNRTSGMDNDYDDLNYAMIASYAGQLWTKDKGLALLTHVCFPDVTVVTGEVAA